MTPQALYTAATPRQRDILEVLAQHPMLGNDELGEKVGMTGRTVGQQLTLYYRDSGLFEGVARNSRRQQLVLWLTAK